VDARLSFSGLLGELSFGGVAFTSQFGVDLIVGLLRDGVSLGARIGQRLLIGRARVLGLTLQARRLVEVVRDLDRKSVV